MCSDECSDEDPAAAAPEPTCAHGKSNTPQIFGPAAARLRRLQSLPRIRCSSKSRFSQHLKSRRDLACFGQTHSGPPSPLLR